MGNIDLKLFPASYGDSFLVSCNGKNKTNILIDMGFKSTYTNVIKDELKKLKHKGESLSLLVITHIDEDHILGGIKFLEENGDSESPEIVKIEEIWHNSYKHLQFNKKKVQREITEPTDKSKEILTNVVSKGYPKEHGVREVSNIGFKDSLTLTRLLNKNGYSDKWNKTFDNQAVKVLKEKNKLKTITINEEVKITILSPTIEKLENLDKKWERELIELGFKKQVTSDQLLDDAFEIFMANIYEKKKKTRKTSNISGRVLDIETIANQTFSPDPAEINGSSISFILEFDNKRILFLGDSHSDVIEESLSLLLLENDNNKLYFNAVKISHHGSKHNTSKDLLNLFVADEYIISTNGRGKGFHHPDIECICRIITSNKDHKKKIVFNYKPIHLYEQINNQQLKEKYNYDLEYTNDITTTVKNEVKLLSFK